MNEKDQANTVEKPKPRNRSGGVFVKPEEVNLHANDFVFDEKCSLLNEHEKEYIHKYTELCTTSLINNAHFNSYEGQTKNNSWDGHFSQSRHHFPLKNYIFHAFPILKKYLCEGSPSIILECGCGTGSTLLPLIHNFGCKNTLFVGFDISSNALKHFSQHSVASPLVNEEKLILFQYDIAGNYSSVNEETDKKKRKLEENIAHHHLNTIFENYTALNNKRSDVILLVFVLSALPSVEAMYLSLKRLWNVLKPGGIILFRDYGIADHNFFRFISRDSGVLKDISFKKGDGTTQVFFEKQFTVKLFELCGFVPDNTESVIYHCNRLTNRKNGKTMDKIFINAVFRKVDPVSNAQII